MLYKTYFLLFLCLAIQRTALNQTLQNKFRVIGKAEGLPSLLNMGVYETSDGYFWLATQTGLIKYDGKKFEPFYAYFTDSNSITGNIVTDLQEDNQQLLWIGSFSAGMSTYHLRTGQWKQYKHPTPDNNPIYRILDFYYDETNILWIGTGGRGLLQFDRKTEKFIQYVPSPDLPADGTDGNANTIREISADPSNPDIPWLATMDGLYRFSKSTRLFTHYENRKNGQKKWQDNCFHSILTPHGDIIWLGTWAGGLVEFNKRTAVFTNFPMNKPEYEKNNLGTNIVGDIFKLTDSSLYIAADYEGLFEFNIHTRKYKPVITSQTSALKEGVAGVFRINETSNNCIWISGMNNIYLQHPVYNRFGEFHKLNRPSENKPAYPSELRDVLWLPESNRYLMAANASKGVLEYDKDFNFIRYIPLSGTHNQDISAISIQRDGTGKIWLAVKKSPYLYYYDPPSDLFQRSFVPAGKMGHFLIDRKNRIWTATDSFIVQYDIRSSSYRKFPVVPEKSSGLKLPLLPNRLREDEQGNIWIATNIGLWKLDLRQQHLMQLYPSTHRPGSSLADAFVTSIAAGKNGQVWIATESQGLQVLDGGSNKFIAAHHVHSQSSFRSTQVNYIETDTAGNIWVATNNGLGILRQGNEQWDWFDERDGIPKDYLDQPLFVAGNNKVIIAQRDGFIAFDANSRHDNKSYSHMKLTGLLIDGENTIGKNQGNPFTINYDQKRINFLFTAIEPIQPDRLHYQYKLEGYDTDWQTTVTGNVQYTGLQAGSYSFLVKAGINDGKWSKELRIPVIVLLPFWKKSWFIMVVLLLIAGILYAIYRYRIGQLLQLQKIRNDISRNLHDELGSTVSSMSMLATVAKKQMLASEPVYGLLNQIGESALQAGESIDEMIWSIQPGQEPALATMNRIRSYASGLFESIGIHHEITFEIPEKLKLSNTLRMDIWLVCKEAVNNIIKFSKCRKAGIVISYKDNFLEVHISDDGKGFDLEQALLSGRNGLKNMQSRTMQYKKAVFTIESRSGTHVYCRFPVSNGPKM